jgi:hypothetical protein
MAGFMRFTPAIHVFRPHRPGVDPRQRPFVDGRDKP